ncbi:MAG: zinc ribbon domain-containing protein YjdM [Micrococcaceae bacterium]
MTETLPACPECSSPYTYAMDALLVCPECAHEWTAESSAGADGSASADGSGTDTEIRDAVGNLLHDGDAVTITTTMKVKGAQQALKAGTKVRSIRLMPENGDHNISARVDGFGQMELKSSIVKKN